MRAAGLLLALAAAVALAFAALLAPRAAADGWRAAFLLLSAPPLGAVALMLIGRVVGAEWDAALAPMLGAVPWLALLWVPVAIGQSLFHHPNGHLHVWLSLPLFALRSLIALAFWAWLARALRRDAVRQAGPLLLAHGLVVSVMGYDWLLGTAPGHPQSAFPMVLATMQIGGAAALACLARLGPSAVRRDLAYLLVASALGLAYLLYMDFVIIWFGNLPEHVDWYVDRLEALGALLPSLALALGLVVPILLVGLGRTERSGATAGGTALAALGLTCLWIVGGDGGWWALLAAGSAVAAVGLVAREALA